MKRMYRQGDVLIVEAHLPDQDRYLAEAKDRILVYGESTGHAHRVDGPREVIVYDLWGRDKYISAPTPFRLVHDEHDTIEIPEGFYRVIRQREYDERESRYVRD